MKILTVCLGNICRSPLAQGILEKVIAEHKLKWKVDSAGTSGWHEGENPDPRSIQIAQMHGIDIKRQKSRKFITSDFDAFDRILVMDEQNMKDVLNLARDKKDESKVSLILSYDTLNSLVSVPDPYYDNSFQRSYDLLFSASKAFIQEELKSLKARNGKQR